MKPAKPLNRVAAYIVDFLITGITMLVIYFIFSFDFIFLFNKGILNMDFNTAIHFYRVTVVNALLICSYFTLVPYILDGQTLGKKIFRIKVVMVDGSKITFASLFVREILGKLLLNFINIFLANLASFVLMLYREDKRAIGDIFAKTMVVDITQNYEEE
jgi:uncharacterized RDD family membrane protein YckC